MTFPSLDIELSVFFVAINAKPRFKTTLGGRKNNMVKVGNRIKVLHMVNDPSWEKTIHKGDLGTVTRISTIELLNQTQIWVQFDNGSHLALLDGVDQYEIIEN